VTYDHVSTVSTKINSVLTRTIDDQPFDRAGPGTDSQPVSLALVASISISGLPAKPGWVVPSMITGSLIVGSTDAGAIVCTPAPAILKAMKSVPGVAFA